jgi:hypothetical protein
MLRRRSAVALELHAREEALRAGLDGIVPAPETAYRLGLPASSPLILLGFAPAGTSPPSVALLARTGSDLGRHWAAVRPTASVATGPRVVYALLPGEDPASARRCR